VAFDADRLSKKAKGTLEEARRTGEGLAISDMTLLELAMLVSKKRIPLDVSAESFLAQVENRASVLPMNAKICARAFAMPPTYFKDPAGRIIGATALVEGIPLITAAAKSATLAPYRPFGEPRYSVRFSSVILSALCGKAFDFIFAPFPRPFSFPANLLKSSEKQHWALRSGPYKTWSTFILTFFRK